MIDWLDFTIELQHPRIKTGEFILTNEDDEIIRCSPTMKKIEGSYSSNVLVKSTSAISFYSECALSLGLFKGVDDREQASAISFYGNPTKFLQGHNIIGVDCIKSLVSNFIQVVFPKIGLSDYIFQALQKVNNLDFWVTRIDITHLFNLGNNKNVEDYLYMLPLTVKARGDRCDYTKSTFYIGKHSTTWTIKIYNKYKELTSKSLKHRLNKKFENTNLLQFSNGKLRVELTLRKKELDRKKLTYAKFLQTEIHNLFIEYMGRITMTNQKPNQAKLYNLSNSVISTFYRWERGENLKSSLSKPTFYRHRKLLLDVGVDIALQPVPDSERKSNIISFVKTLEPSLVKWSDIPNDVLRYVVKPQRDIVLKRMVV